LRRRAGGYGDKGYENKKRWRIAATLPAWQPWILCSSLRFDIRGFRCEKMRRGKAVLDNLTGQATNLRVS
jgi:hypothetical protein